MTAAVREVGVTGRCPTCKKTGIPVRISGAPGVIGNLHKHRSRRGVWCTYTGLPSRSRRRRPVLAPDGAGSLFDNLNFGATGFGTFINTLVEEEQRQHPLQLVPSVSELEDRTAKREALARWWEATAGTEIDMVVDKAIQYGATDLRDLGRQIYEMARRPMPDDATATQAGIAFYVIGKVSRVSAAIAEGRWPSMDTWTDIGVYARMAQRVQQTGGWPGV